MSEGLNDFEKLIDMHGEDTRDTDLLKVFEVKSALRTQELGLVVPLMIQIGLSFSNLSKLSFASEWVTILYYVGILGAMAYFIYTIWSLQTTDSFAKHRTLLSQYINARKKLHEPKSD